MKEARKTQTLQYVNGAAHKERTDDGEEVLVRVENLSKKFCRDLKRSLWYGLQDMTGEVLGRSKKDTLRKDEFWAVKGVSFELRRGECLGLIGHNGAGKSTLLKMLNGLIKPDQGRIEMNGRVGALIELGAGFNPILTGRENVYINGQILGFSKKEIDEKYEAIVEFAELQDFMETPVQSYSSGMKVRLGFAIAAQMEPDILIIDEVLAVGDIGFRIKCLNAISNIIKNASVIFVSHSMPQIARISNRVIMLRHGKIHFTGTSISRAIEEYFDAFENEQSIVEGDGIIIDDCQIWVDEERIDSDIKNPKPVAFGSDLNFYLKFLSIADYEIMRIALTVYDKEMKPIGISNFEVQKVISGEYKTLKINLNNNQLSLGTYSLSFIFYEYIDSNKRVKTISHHRAIRTFKISGEMDISHAPLRLSCSWIESK